MNNENECNNYEGYFVFKSDREFLEHLQNCEDCKKEHEKYLKVSQLVREVAPEYLKKKQREKVSAMKRLACCFVFFVGLTAFTGYEFYNNYKPDLEQDNSCISVMGLPVDEYGLLEI